LLTVGVFHKEARLLWLVVSSPVAEKCIGILLFGVTAAKLGLPLPAGVRGRALFVIGSSAALVSPLPFISREAFADPVHQGEAKNGAMLSCVAAAIALIGGKLLKIKKILSFPVRSLFEFFLDKTA
jgi:hypothetical protein